MDLNNKPNIVFMNGNVLTVDKQDTIFESLAIKTIKLYL